MYCAEKRINKCKIAIKDLPNCYTPSLVPNYTLYWRETQYPMFWMHFAAALENISWTDMYHKMDYCIKTVKNYKPLLDFHFW